MAAAQDGACSQLAASTVAGSHGPPGDHDRRLNTPHAGGGKVAFRWWISEFTTLWNSETLGLLPCTMTR
jgi:hypothetical protein